MTFKSCRGDIPIPLYFHTKTVKYVFVSLKESTVDAEQPNDFIFIHKQAKRKHSLLQKYTI